jgi:uncharacterized damage-inducible protein DinB
MAGDRDTLELFYYNWKLYMDMVKAALAPLSDEQLDLRTAPHERSVGEIARHVVAARILWFREFLGEAGGNLEPYESWGLPDAPSPTAGELVQGLDATWEFMAQAFARWTTEDMHQTFPHVWRDTQYDLPRSWVIWHILEHDLAHAGEISLTLGTHGLDAPRP